MRAWDYWSKFVCLVVFLVFVGASFSYVKWPLKSDLQPVVPLAGPWKTETIHCYDLQSSLNHFEEDGFEVVYILADSYRCMVVGKKLPYLIEVKNE
jgi:hypothetical protein